MIGPNGEATPDRVEHARVTPPRRRKRRFVPPPPEDEREVWCVRAFYLAVAAVLISLAALSPQAADKLGPVLTTLLRLGGLPQ